MFIIKLLGNVRLLFVLLIRFMMLLLSNVFRKLQIRLQYVHQFDLIGILVRLNAKLAPRVIRIITNYIIDARLVNLIKIGT